ncbi:MAG: hypothetical protein II854_07090 [Prevotella sp.]|jgi:hypothetical protein|nr:hypothetical protein [Prevotella sp.]
MKKQYIAPLTEVVNVRTYRLLQGDATGTITPDPNPSDWSTNDWVDGRRTDYMEEDTEDEGFGYRRYNLWDR